MNKEEIKQKIRPAFDEFGVKKAALFGSAARGEITEASDIDILVELPDQFSLFDVMRLKIRLEDILGKNVDLVEYSEIKPAIKDYILKDESLVYGA